MVVAYPCSLYVMYNVLQSDRSITSIASLATRMVSVLDRHHRFRNQLMNRSPMFPVWPKVLSCQALLEEFFWAITPTRVFWRHRIFPQDPLLAEEIHVARI